jgi:poly(3-hydroxybutyrate) depolymerase
VGPGTAGCGKPTSELGLKDDSVQVGGSRRTFIRYVSPNYDANRRHILIIGYHGLGLDGTSPRRDHKWTTLEESSGDAAIFLYANAAGGSWSGGANSRDVNFFDELVRATGDEFCLEKSRVFVHGFSNGAFFVNSLASVRTTAIRGVISVAGGGGGAKIPVMVIHGKQDPNVGFYGSAPGTVDAYVRANGCKARPNLDQLKADTCQLIEGCPANLPVWVCPWNGNHHWPEFTLPDVWKFITTT